jgi:filamentous hemagglutinin
MATQDWLMAGRLNNIEARRWYHQELARIPRRIDRSHPLEQQARQAYRLRHDAQIQARRAMQDRRSATALPEPRTWEALVARYRAAGLSGDAVWQAILDAASRAGRTIDEAAGL